MRKVKYAFGDEPGTNKTGIVFTHWQHDNKGWVKANFTPSEYDDVVYLGRDGANGDMFVTKVDGVILIYKGHLNNGTY